MALNFNTQPYHDDFNEDKNFHRILFKPGVSVQARELTQIQSILQDQIGKFGKFVLSDGSKVSGGRYFIDTNAKSLKLIDTGTLSSDIQNFVGNYVVGQSSKCVGFITDSDIINYYIIVKPIVNGSSNFQSNEDLFIFNSKQLAIANSISSTVPPVYSTKLSTDSQIQITGCSGNINSFEFSINSSAIEIGDVITIQNSENPYDTYIVTEFIENGKFRVNKQLDENYVSVIITVSKFSSRNVMEVGFDSGIYFSNNTFIKALPQTIIPNNKLQYPSCVVGYEVIETIVDFIDDSSLLDPAQGSYNYTAPGADRYKIYLQLVYKPYVGGEIQNLTSNKFIELLRISNGVIVKDSTNPVLGELAKTLARQMFDHAGNFITKPFTISFHDSDFKDSQQSIKAEVSSGKCYINGFEFEQSFPTFFNIDKGRDTNSVLNYKSSFSYGNHISITKPSGIFLDPKSSSRVELHSISSDKVNLTSFIAYAYVRNIKFVSDNEYELYLYNISSTDISKVKSVVIPTSSTYSSLTFKAETVLDGNVLPLIDPQLNSLLFKLPYSNIALINNVDLSIDTFNTFSVVSNSFSIHSGALTKMFPSGTGTLSSDVKKANFIIVAQTTNGGYSSGDYVNLNDVVITVSLSGAEYIATFTFTNGYVGSVKLKYGLQITAANEKLKTEVFNTVVKLNADTVPVSLKIADISSFNGVFSSPNSSSTYIGEWNSGQSYSKGDVVLIGSVLYHSFGDSNLNNRPSPNSSLWGKLVDETQNYVLNNGQTESIYDHGSIIAKFISAAKPVFVMFNYYTHSSAGEFFYLNSYILDYSKLPTQKINNISYNMRDYLDFRPRRTNNVNTMQFDNYQILSSIFNQVQYDLSYYLGRIDKLVLTENKVFQWLRGIPSYTNYVPPVDIPNAMTLATIKINPYTFSSTDISISYQKHRRYTMDDIGGLDTRISNVEYYTTLNMVEKNVMSTNIYDNVTGNRMTNGFVVDPFVGYGVMSISENYQNCSLDLAQQCLRPSFIWSNFDANIKDIKTFSVKNDIVSFPFTETPFAYQLVATSSMSCNPFDVVSYAGTLILSPQSDNWVDVETKPIINVIDEDTSALDAALLTPGNVFNDWNSFYATHPYKPDLGTVTTVTQEKAIYTVGTAVVLSSDKTEEISLNVIPYARSIPITFRALHLSPMSRMYVYVNGRLVNGYVTPSMNPKGFITSASIINSGTNYSSNSSSVSIIASNSQNAVFSVETTASKISFLEISNRGLNYPTSNSIVSVVSGAGANASISISTIPQIGDDLYTNENGECFGVLTLPNDEILKFPSGELHVIICDNPNYQPDLALVKAEAIFYSSGKKKTLQETITSIREPYVKFVGWEPPTPTQGAEIVVLNTADYKILNDDYNYNDFIRKGTILLPVHLNKKPNSAVTISVQNASLDQTSKVNYSISPNSLTFNDVNYNTIQNFTLTYDLGDLSSPTSLNSLFSYLEYYGTSLDLGYNFSGAKPNYVWTQKNKSTGVSFTKFNSTTKLKPVPLPAKLICSQIPPAQGSSITEFFITPYGEKLATHLPITFTVTPANTSICYVSGIFAYANTSLINSNSIVISNILDLDTFKVRLAYTDTGATNNSIVVSSTSGSAYWNGVTSNTTFSHLLTPIPVPDPKIVVVENSENPRYTDEDGKTTTIGVRLSTNPYANVTITGTSSDSSEGIVDKYSSNGTVYIGNAITFTSNNWNTQQVLLSTGKPDSILDGTVIYYANLVSTSSNSYWNGLSSSVKIENRDTTVIPPPVPGNIVCTYKNGISQTSESGNTVTLLVSLDKTPTSDVTINAQSSLTTEGQVSANGVMIFTSNNWSTPKNVVVTGQPDSGIDGLQNYSVVLTSTSNDSDWNARSKIMPLSNMDTSLPQTPGTLVYTFSGTTTTESGGFVTGTVQLSKAPTSSVSVTITSSVLGEGKVTNGSSLTFTTTNWNVNQNVTITGQNDGVWDTDKTYYINLNTISSDQLFNNISNNVQFTNTALSAPAVGNVNFSYPPSPTTSESGTKVTISVQLSRAPLTNITVSCYSDNLVEGQVTVGSSLTFTPTNWNTAQLVIVTGQSDGIVDQDKYYNVIFSTTSNETLEPNGFKINLPLNKISILNTNIDIPTKTVSIVSVSSTYSVASNNNPTDWLPGITIQEIIFNTDQGWGYDWNLGWETFGTAPTATVIQNTKTGTTQIQVSAALTWYHAWLAYYLGKDVFALEMSEPWAPYDDNARAFRLKFVADAKTSFDNVIPINSSNGNYLSEFLEGTAISKWTIPPCISSITGGIYTLYSSSMGLENSIRGVAYEAAHPGLLWQNSGYGHDLCFNTYNINNLYPKFDTFGLSVTEHKTTTTTMEVVNSVTGAVISVGTPTTVVADNIVWSWASGNTYPTGNLNAAAKTVLYSWFGKFSVPFSTAWQTDKLRNTTFIER